MITIDGLRLRRVLGRDEWSVPVPWGNGFALNAQTGRVIVTWGYYGPADEIWIHASMSRTGRVPSYEELCLLHRAAFAGWAYHVFPPADEKINYHEHTLHLFGPEDGQRRLPDFTLGMGMI